MNLLQIYEKFVIFQNKKRVQLFPLHPPNEFIINDNLAYRVGGQNSRIDCCAVIIYPKYDMLSVNPIAYASLLLILLNPRSPG
jgi:hypothetical protein